MEVGKTYNVVFFAGRYEIGFENSVKCIEKTAQFYRIRGADGSTTLVRQDSIIELTETDGPT